MAMQRAMAIMMRPTIYWGLSLKKIMERANMRTGPMTQFMTRERVRTLMFLKTWPSSSYLTLARGGYIMRVRPMAGGKLVVPGLEGVMKAGGPGIEISRATPMALG